MIFLIDLFDIGRGWISKEIEEARAVKESIRKERIEKIKGTEDGEEVSGEVNPRLKSPCKQS